MILPRHLASLPLKAVTKETGSVRTVAIKRIEGKETVIDWPRASDLSQDDSVLLGAVLAV